ncbi:hypothetical protein [Actinokineospora xionganensis]|uniref:DUF4142 domain-containing protein n=1 Tax=Actinokineospora xionganensis TaxID=2684470 RepID=A0ABR7L9N4_9PSEU|nr:hypothetical protein [Actinokineospora xionganensis]MBC6449268.1 hypothetical protein [Actinokineospora xionganensis]
MTRIAITIVTFGALAVALVLGVTWFAISEPGQRFEPAVNTLALLAGITGIFAERWAAQRERRQQAIESIVSELARNREVLAGDEFSEGAPGGRKLYSRLLHSAVDSAFTSGALSLRRDTELISLLHQWRGQVSSVNRRLELTEMLMFTTASADEADDFNKALRTFMPTVRSHLDEVESYLGAMRSEPSRRITSPLR